MHSKKRTSGAQRSEDPPGDVVHETRVFKAGNSLAIRIPSAIAKQAGLVDGTTVEIIAHEDALFIRKAPSRELADLIDQITPANLHEPEFDELIGAERW